ncbi:unnamed protein product [Ixodes hexagonus]
MQVPPLPPIPEFTDVPLKVPVPVWVSHFLSPTKFWLRLLDDKHRDPYIRDFVRGQTKHFYTVNVGTNVVADTGKNFDLARAFVLDVQRDSLGMAISAEVFCVDYGLTLVVGMDKLFPLSEIDAQIPCLAIPCCLRRLTSPSVRLRDVVDWSVTPDAKLEAIFYGTSEAGVYQVDLFVITGENGQVRLNVAKDLIEKGIATRIWYPQPPQKGKIASSSLGTRQN